MRIILLYSLLLFGAKLGAQPVALYTPELQQAFGYVVEMRFEEARKLVEQDQRSNPQNRVPDYLNAAMICVELFVNEDSESYDSQQEEIDEAIDRIEDLPDSEPFRNLFLGELYTAQAILNGKFKNTLTAAWQFYKAYGLLTENYKEFPDFKPTYVPLGVMYAGIGSLPDEYRSMASLLGFEGSVAQGMGMLQSAYRELSADPEWRFYQPYAGFVYSYADYQLGAEPEMSPEKLGLDVASSRFLIFLQALYEVEQAHPEQAVKWLEKRPTGEEYIDFNYLYYLHGKTLLGLNPDKAKDLLMTYLKETSSSLYLKSSYRYLSWYYLLKGKEKKAEEMREMVYRRGDLSTGADRQAMEENQRPLNPVLIKARLWFDAARFEEAKSLLLLNPPAECCASTEENVEYHYRLGRIYESMGETSAAMEQFKKALAVPDADATYARGNSALQLALLYHEQAQESKAKAYYKDCLRISKYPFYEGVHQKAKAGLSRLRN